MHTDAELEWAFRQPHYLALNKARLEHLGGMLDTLKIDLKGKHVLDVGAGIGDLSQWIAERGASVLATDARSENVDYMNRRGLNAETLDCDTHVLSLAREPDFVLAYGILYHLKEPSFALHLWGSLAGKAVFIETMVASDTAIFGVTEDKYDLSQSASGFGCRPTLWWIKRCFVPQEWAFVIPEKQPDHPDYAEGRRAVCYALRRDA